MSFTYDLTTEVGQVRLEIGDNEYQNGAKPDSTNFRDDEIQIWLTREGSVLLASAAACEALARLWSRMADITVGPRRENYSTVAGRYADQAAALRARLAETGEAYTTFSAGLARTDGYSVEAASESDY
jgi:hypothetical protein